MSQYSDFSEFEQRKRDHIQLALDERHQSSDFNRFDEYHFEHEAIPDLNFSDLCLQSPQNSGSIFFVSSMTAGHEHALKINRHLMAACHERQWEMGVGSQRRELEDSRATQEWAELRREFPRVKLMANLGLAQVISSSLSELQSLVDNLQAFAFIVHCNALQEVIQPEGTPFFKGAWLSLERLVKGLGVPVILKETGCGFSAKTLKRLADLGVAAIDISGLGGTHWGRIEGSRIKNDKILARSAQTFANWGVPTIEILKQVRDLGLKTEIWASGGIRHGLDAAKSFALGASKVGIAKPILQSALQGIDEVLTVMDCFHQELKIAMFCTGSPTIAALQTQKLYQLGVKK